MGVLKDKSYDFSVRVVNLSKYLTSEKKEYVISKQVVRSGTAVGALIREAEFAQSTADYIHKFSIALKEANETVYWLQLLYDTDYINKKMANSIIPQAKELVAMLVSTIKTLKAKS